MPRVGPSPAAVASCVHEAGGIASIAHPGLLERDEWLDAIQKRDVETIELDVRDATAMDQVMVGTVKAKWRLKYLGRIIEDCVLLTDVWVKDEGRWRAIRRHSTPAPAVPRCRAGGR